MLAHSASQTTPQTRRVQLTGMPELVLMPAPVITTTFLALDRAFAMSCNSRSDPGVTWTVGILGSLSSCGRGLRKGAEEVRAPPWNREVWHRLVGVRQSQANVLATPLDLCSTMLDCARSSSWTADFGWGALLELAIPSASWLLRPDASKLGLSTGMCGVDGYRVGKSYMGL